MYESIRVSKSNHHWTIEEKQIVNSCRSTSEIRNACHLLNLSYPTVRSMWKYLHHLKNTTGAMAQFDYKKIKPLKSLFTRCPVCGGTTGVNKNAYCHSCLSQWHPLYLYPLNGLHKADPVD